MRGVEIELSWDCSIVLQCEGRAYRVLTWWRRAGAEAGEGKHQQMRARSLASAASPSAVVSGCACGTRRARYTTSSKDAGRGWEHWRREQARRGKSPLRGRFACGDERALGAAATFKESTGQHNSGRESPPAVPTPSCSESGDLDGVSATPELKYPVPEACLCRTEDKRLAGALCAADNPWGTGGTDAIRTHENASFGLRVGVICVAEVAEHCLADIDNDVIV